MRSPGSAPSVPGAANHILRPKRLPFMLFKMLTVVDEEDDVPRRNSEHREEPDKRAD